MNKFQAMAQIMAILCEDGKLKRGTPDYKLARKLISSKIDRLGPDAALAQVEGWRGSMHEQVDIMSMLQDVQQIFPNYPF